MILVFYVHHPIIGIMKLLKFHQYLNPQREIDQGAISIHGITNEFLQDKPLFKDVKVVKPWLLDSTPIKASL